MISVPPKHALAYVVKRLKGASSHDLNQAAGLQGSFAWQRGYGALSLGEGQRPVAEAYVANQKEHHRLQETNAWLERYAQFDEGPVDTGIKPDGVPPLAREQQGIYDTWGEPPF